MGRKIVERDWKKEYAAAKANPASWLHSSDAKVYQNDWHKKYAKKRVAQIAVLKKYMGGCVDCGYNDNPHALQFDHLPQYDKKCAVAHLHSGSWTSILTEMSKCELVCANCHIGRTMTRNKEKAI